MEILNNQSPVPFMIVVGVALALFAVIVHFVKPLL